MTSETALLCGYGTFLAGCAGGFAFAARSRSARSDAEFAAVATRELRRGLSLLLSILAFAFLAVAVLRAPWDADVVAVAALLALLLTSPVWWRRLSRAGPRCG